jgi:hypothetical protein
MNEKNWYESKTLMTNLAVAILCAIEAVTGAIQPILPAPIFEVFTTFLLVSNSILRVFTEQPIKLK